MAGKSSSLSFTLWMVLVEGSRSQDLSKLFNTFRLQIQFKSWHVSVSDEIAEKQAGAQHQHHPDKSVQPVLSIHKISNSVDSWLLKNGFDIECIYDSRLQSTCKYFLNFWKFIFTLSGGCYESADLFLYYFRLYVFRQITWINPTRDLPNVCTICDLIRIIPSTERSLIIYGRTK